MIVKSFIFILTSKLILAQINGEFWWLSDKLPYVTRVEEPKIEDNNEFDTDESAKIIFRDNYKANNKISAITVGDKINHKSEQWTIDTHYKEDNKITDVDLNPDINRNNKTNVATEELHEIENIKKIHNRKTGNQDEFKFYFPDDYLLSKDKDPGNSNKIATPNKNLQFRKDKMTLTNKDETMASENICSYMKKLECHRQKGVVHKQTNRIDSTSYLDDQLICCILPLVEEESSRLVFPSYSYKRQKRSKQIDGINIALNQREVLMKRQYGTSVDKRKDETSKIVSLDEDDEDYSTDPYWNIKSTKIKSTSAIHDCYQDEDYVVELPKPGLLGVYSDHSRPGWPVNDNRGQYGGNAYDDNYDDDVPGYSTIDPRRDTTTSKFPKRGKPFKLSTVTEDNDNPESQTISFQSNPDFQVLQGFKLINLSRSRNKFYTNSKKIKAVSVIEENSEDSVLTDSSSENRNKDFVSSNKQNRNCGKVTGNFVSRNGKQLGSSENGSHPWLGLVVLSKRRQSILCYATIVHSRAALTTADCVYGRPSEELTLVAGLRDLKDKSSAQYRTTSSLLHPQYKHNELAHNLAVLHWTLPLKLTINVQPACLGEPQGNRECFIYGWGGYDQAIRSRSRWQRAAVLTPRQCQVRLPNQSSPRLPSGAFCAEVEARGTVTGVGGPLVCEAAGRHVAAGVAVWRRRVLVLLPTRGWPDQALDSLLGST